MLLQRPDAGDHRWETLEFVPACGVLRWRLADGDAHLPTSTWSFDRWNPCFRFEVRHTLRMRRVGPTVEVCEVCEACEAWRSRRLWTVVEGRTASSPAV